MGHSFVHRFHTFLAQSADRRVRLDLNLSRSAHVNYHGVGGRTVDKLNKFNLSEVVCLKPEIVILELGSNDLSPEEARPEHVGSKIESLVQLLHAQYSVKFIVVCQSVHGVPHLTMITSALSVATLAWFWRRYLLLLFGATKGFLKPSVPMLCRDGVHLNYKGQYALYRSYRGAISCAFRSLSLSLSPKADQLIAPPAYFRSWLLPIASV